MRIAYLDCIAGASGDMVLGALLDAGLPLETLMAELRKLPLTGFDIKAAPTRRGVIGATRVTVETGPPAGKGRHLPEILDMISSSSLADDVKARSASVFTSLATAEAKVHRTRLEEVHFHEVGAMDAIVDIVGACLGFRLMGVDKVYSSPLPSGSGTVETAHGLLPVPAPATVELLSMAGAPLRIDNTPGLGELVTPTGAAIITTLAVFEEPVFKLRQVGYGAGSRHLEKLPNVLRLYIGEESERTSKLLLVETNIDNTTPEVLGFVLDRLLEMGARDAWFTPIQMKKSRPAVMLSVIVSNDLERKAIDEILAQTGTLGVRVREIKRHEAERRSVSFDSSLGKVSLKLKVMNGLVRGVSPEYEDCRRLAAHHNLPLQEVYRIVAGEAADKLRIGR